MFIKKERERREGSSSSNTKMRDKRNKMLSSSIEKINIFVHIV
jgi:hypothetical protein